MTIERIMKEARDAREDRARSIENEARFLVARLREYEPECQCEGATREWNGHVSPSLARLETLLST
jgi:hypothetical protein